MPRIRVDPKAKHPRPYWPRELKDEGFVGEMICINDAMTATFIHPAVTDNLEAVRKSLELTLKDIDLRIEREKVGAGQSED